MARASENTRTSQYVLKVVCEGEKTEPLFFTSLFEQYFSDKGIIASTVPQPKIPEDNDDVSRERGGYKGKKRTTASSPIDDEPVIKGQPPLKWVRYARYLLQEEGVNEAWAAFDKDEHPACEQAFQEADELVDGKRVNIAFSSRSFEYYLLLHFEYLYHAFHETECNSKTKVCGTDSDDATNCHGETCINGYARSKGYWSETKTSESTYPLVKDNLLKGIANAIKLRAESDSNEQTPVYLRNPYTNADRLVGRVIGVDPIDNGEEYHYSSGGDDFTVSFLDGVLNIRNNGGRTLLVTPRMVVIYNTDTHEESLPLEKNSVVSSGETFSKEIALAENCVLLIRTASKSAIFAC